MNKILRISILVVICLILILGVALLIGQCSKKDSDDTTTTTTTTPSTTKPTTPPNPVCTNHVDNDTDYLCDNCGKELERPTPDPTFVETDDTVYVIPTELNLRNNPNETGVATVSVFMDSALTRMGYYTSGDNKDWSKVVYNGEEYYVPTNLITTQEPLDDDDFTSVDEIVYFTAVSVTYSKPSYIFTENYSEKCETFFVGESVRRTGVATRVFVDDEDGKEYTFARIEYYVKVGGVDTLVVRYVNNNYLTTDANPSDCGITFTKEEITLVVTATTFNLRTSAEYPADNIGKQVGTDTELKTIAIGRDADNDITWYKVTYNDEVYYIIYNELYVQVKTPVAE